ncbi:MAG: DNA translocase FtsK 4TM domain-containing protein [Patescibacteria group bacterium]
MPKKRFKKNKKLVKSKKLKAKKSLLYSETKKGIFAIVCFALAMLSFLSFFNAAGLFGEYFLKISKMFFGKGFFLVSLSFILIGVAIILPRFNLTGRKTHIYRAVFIGIILFIISVLGAFYVFGKQDINSGGYLGLILGYPMFKYLGFWASLVTLSSLLIISILVTFNVSFISRKKEEVLMQEPSRILDAEVVGKKESKIGLWQKIKGKAKDEFSSNKEKIAQNDKDNSLENKKGSVINASAGQMKMFKKKQFTSDFKMPSLDFLEEDKGQPTSGDIKANINIIKRTLENFGIEVEMAEVNIGPTVTQYTLRPAQGVKLSKIISLQNDLALALAAHPIRIEAPIPGRALVGIEIPNRLMVLVRLRSLLERSAFQESLSPLTFALGRDVSGSPMFASLAQMPHLLVAGATGTGKTVALNNIIISLLYGNSPDNLKLILIDPKRVELTSYQSIPHLLSPVIVQADKAIGALRWAVSEMERRFEVLQHAGKRDISSYIKSRQDSNEDENLPYIVIIIDELADLMSSNGREVEAAIVRLAQMARAVGIHLVVSTQRPSVEIITGLIKANITSRMACQVASQIDSRTILDMAGAEKLLGNGDMLFLTGSATKPKRIQGAYVSDKEVKKVTDYLKTLQEPDYKEEVSLNQSTSTNFGSGLNISEADDELYEDAKEVVVRAGKASASLLQRRLRVGYARAARLIDILEEKGIVGPADGARPRDVFINEGEKKYD